MLVIDIRELDDVRRIHNTLQLLKMVGNMLERCATVHHHVKDTSKRPYVTGSANLLSDKRREKAECRVGSITSRCSRTERALLGKGQDRTDWKGGGWVGEEMERESMAENEPKCHADENVR